MPTKPPAPAPQYLQAILQAVSAQARRFLTKHQILRRCRCRCRRCRCQRYLSRYQLAPSCPQRKLTAHHPAVTARQVRAQSQVLAPASARAARSTATPACDCAAALVSIHSWSVLLGCNSIKKACACHSVYSASRWLLLSRSGVKQQPGKVPVIPESADVAEEQGHI